MKLVNLLLSPSNVVSWLKRFKYQQQFSAKRLRIGYHSSIYNSQIGNHNCLGDNVVLTNVQLGDYTYINGNTIIRNASIGKFSSIATGVLIGLGKHPVHFVSTHPAFYSSHKQFITFADNNDYFKEYDKVTIGNDVWIGTRVMIVDGVSIGDGAIIAAGAVVTKNVEPYSIVGGVPAKLIKYRFNQDTIDKITKTQWWNRDINYYLKNYHLFHNVEQFLNES